jgi:hypothetical protein
MNGAVVRRAGKALKAAGFLIRHWSLLQQNRRFRDRHKGQRAFILCNGPSVLKQDLLPLRNEIVMSVSSGYLHKNFEHIRPKYHFVPPLTYGMISEEDAVRWFMEMDGRLGETELFLGSSEYRLVKDHLLFPGRSVNYLCAARPFWPNEKAIVDVCGPVPAFVSVPIMCLIVALYMGFQNVYLLGTDHDSFATGRYRYAFEPTVLRGKDFSVDEAGNLRIPLYDELKANLLLWGQYRCVKRIAHVNRRNIYNASAGGVLDEFPRVNLEEVLNSKHAPD